MKHLLCLGLGYSAENLARRLKAQGWHIAGTTRSEASADRLRQCGYAAIVCDGKSPSPGVAQALQSTTHILVSAAPDEQGDPFLANYLNDIAKAPRLEWIGYLSTIGVYGDHGGNWVDEAAELRATSRRGRQRIGAEGSWLQLGRETGIAVQVFRLAGIYGPGRSPLDRLRHGTAQRIIKPGQVFNRIHVEDIAEVLAASIASPRPGAIYNVADDEPVPPQDVLVYGAELLGIAPPPEVPFAQAELTAMARSFYADNKRVRNTRIRMELAVELRYPTYREGLAALI